MTATQLKGIHSKIRAVIAYYPVVNWTISSEDKVKASTVMPGKKEDLLVAMAPIFNYAYIPAGAYLKDPLLSPHYAEREKLAPHIFFIGCEYDLLKTEARVMAEKLAEGEAGEKKTLKDGDAWEKGRIRWQLIRGAEHGFNQQQPEKDEKLEAEKRQKARDMHQDVVEWLHRVAFA